MSKVAKQRGAGCGSKIGNFDRELGWLRRGMKELWEVLGGKRWQLGAVGGGARQGLGL